MKKRVLIPVIIILGIVLLVFLLPLPSRINKQMSGVWAFSENQEPTTTVITLNGRLDRYLVRRDCWNGMIEVSGFSPLDSGKHLKLKLESLDKNTFYGNLFMFDELKNRYTVYGTLYFDKNLSYVILKVSKAYGDGCICAPAENDVEAKLLIDRIPLALY